MAIGAFSKPELEQLLRNIDEEVVLELGSSPRFNVVIVGGCALLLSDLTSRATTRDVDALIVDEAIRGVVARHLEVNTQVAVYSDRLPKGFEDRLIRCELDTQAVDFFRPSNEDLAVMKLYSWRKQDQDDLLNPSMLSALDPIKLAKLVYSENGAAASANAPLVYEKMVETFEKRFLPRAAKIAKRARIVAWSER